MTFVQSGTGYVLGDASLWLLLFYPLVLVFSYILLRGVRVFWQLSIAIQILTIVGLPVEGNRALKGLRRDAAR